MNMTLEDKASETGSPAQTEAGTWLSVVSHLHPKYGGLSAGVPALARAVSSSGRSPAMHLAAFCLEGEQTPLPPSSRLAVSYWPLRRFAPTGAFRALVAHAQGVHIHGLWTSSTNLSARLARQLGKPYVISAHGMLEPWALGNKRLKKQVYAAVWERRNLAGAACLHALTDAEAEDYRRFGLRQPVAVIPNGVEVPASRSSTAFLEAFPRLRGQRLVLFLGRLHPKKGVDLLAEAWGSVAPGFPDAHLVFAGPDSEGTRAELERRVETLGLRTRVTFTGMLEGEGKWGALAAAHCFVLPSHSEGLSVAILEALGAGVPVIVTDRCHLPQVARAGAGWEIQPDASALGRALQACLESPAHVREAMGASGRLLAGTNFAWTTVGAQMRDLYTWIGGGPVPRSFDLQRRGSQR